MTIEEKIDPYDKIIEKMREYPNGIPMGSDGNVSKAFIEFIKLLYTPEEAEIAQHLEVQPLLPRKIAKLIGKSKEETKEILEAMADKGIIHDIGGYSHFVAVAHLLNNGYKLINKDIAKRIGKKGAELYLKFFIEEGYYKRYQSSDAGTSMTRVVPVNKAIKLDQKITSAEEMHGVIENCYLPIVITDCPCRSRTDLLDIRECKDKYPVEETCFQVGQFGAFFLRRGEGRELTRKEAHELVDKLAKLGLVFTTENSISPNHMVICSCCECCCAIVRGMTRFDPQNPNNTTKSNYISKVDQDLCKGCGLCAKRCIYKAIIMENDKSSVDAEKCYGCGVCAVTCPTEAIRLYREERSQHYPSALIMGNKVYEENRK